MMLYRTDQGCQYRSLSADGGETWSPAEPTDIKSPVSPASVKRIPKTGDLLLVWNDHADVDDAHRGKRTPLNVAISRDEGQTWEHTRTLEDDPEGWYCYTAIAFVDGRVLLGYCAGDRRVGLLNRTQITVVRPRLAVQVAPSAGSEAPCPCDPRLIGRDTGRCTGRC